MRSFMHSLADELKTSYSNFSYIAEFKLVRHQLK